MARDLLAPGDLVGERYRVIERIGEGGMGAVYLAEHLLLGQRVALKIRRAPTTRETGALRFLNEARAAATLRGPHVARVLDAGLLPGGEPFLVMEYLEGETLAQLLARRGPLPESEAVRHVLEAIEGLVEAHAAGIVHRDLKPANLFLTRTPAGRPCVKVLDFGISKVDGPLAEELESVTTGEAMLGTPAYMAPEQIRASRSVDARADVWALGVVLYELTTGKRPFGGDSALAVALAVMEEKYVPLRELTPDVTPALDDAVRRCLQIAPEFRFPDVNSLSAALGGDDHVYEKPEVALHADSETKPPSGATEDVPATGAAWQTPAPHVRPRGRSLAVLALVVLAGAGAFVAVTRSTRSSAPPPSPVTAATSAAPAASASASAVVAAASNASPSTPASAEAPAARSSSSSSSSSLAAPPIARAEPGAIGSAHAVARAPLAAPAARTAAPSASAAGPPPAASVRDPLDLGVRR